MKNIFKKKKIRTQKTVGQKLVFARKKKNVNLQNAELDTKIRLKYLQSLEQDDYNHMPADVYNIGFLSRYCDYLALPSKNIISQYRLERELDEKMPEKNNIFTLGKKSHINPGNPEGYRERLKFVFTPQTIITIIVILITVGIVSYIWLQVKSFAAAPPLEISNPEQQILVSMQTVTIEGQTDADAELLINGQIVAIEPSGHFRQEVQLVNGLNNVEIKAKNKADKETIKNIQVLATDNKAQN